MARTRRCRTPLVMLFAAIVVLSALLSDWSSASADTYTVQAGDTLSEIALCLNVEESVLLALNRDISSADNIFVGQHLEIPANTQHPSSECAQAATQSYTRVYHRPSPQVEERNVSDGCLHFVASGETLSEIADVYGVDLATMLERNPAANPHLLFPNQALVVPCDSETYAPAVSSEPGQQALTAGLTSSSSREPRLSTVDYVVQSGDGLLLIAERHGVTLEQLLEYNNLSQDSLLHPGEIIQIPIPDHLAPALDPAEAWGLVTGTYVVRSGDSASEIASRYGISTLDLAQLNSSVTLDIIIPGQVLVVPWTGLAPDAPPGTAPAVEARRRSYQVQAGDTFQSIAERHGMTKAELRELNPGRPSDLVVVGQSLYLPGVIAPPIVSEERTLGETDLPQYAAAALGVTPYTLLANHSWLEPDQWVSAGTIWRLPKREGLLVTVRPGDTLQEIANRHGVEMSLILSDSAYGVDDPNALVIGQEIIVPLPMPRFVWPAQGELTDPFGQCRSWDCTYRHKGLDVALDYYAPIVAVADGLVTFVGGDPMFGLGWYVEVDHGDGWRTVYAHLVEFGVAQGQYVSQGQIVGYNGSSGYSTGPHLHLEVRHHDWYVDPLVVLP